MKKTLKIISVAVLVAAVLCFTLVPSLAWANDSSTNAHQSSTDFYLERVVSSNLFAGGVNDTVVLDGAYTVGAEGGNNIVLKTSDSSRKCRVYFSANKNRMAYSLTTYVNGVADPMYVYQSFYFSDITQYSASKIITIPQIIFDQDQGPGGDCNIDVTATCEVSYYKQGLECLELVTKTVSCELRDRYIGQCGDMVQSLSPELTKVINAAVQDNLPVSVTGDTPMYYIGVSNLKVNLTITDDYEDELCNLLNDINVYVGYYNNTDISKIDTIVNVEIVQFQPLAFIFDTMDRLFTCEIFAGITIGHLLLLCIAVPALAAILKKFAGG